MDFRKKALAEFLNDEPEETTPVRTGIYIWRGHYYQILPFRSIKSIQSKPDQFVKYKYRNIVYGIREFSKSLLQQFDKKNNVGRVEAKLNLDK